MLLAMWHRQAMASPVFSDSKRHHRTQFWKGTCWHITLPFSVHNFIKSDRVLFLRAKWLLFPVHHYILTGMI